MPTTSTLRPLENLALAVCLESTSSDPSPATTFTAFEHPEGVEIALVNVPYGTSGESMRPLGLASLGAYLEAQGISTRGFDFSDSQASPEELVERFGLEQYPVIGLSFYNTNATLAFRMAKAIKVRNPLSIVVGGGPHVSAASDRLFRDHPEIDIAVKNEGEVTAAELLTSIREGRPINGIAGISCHKDGRHLVTGDRDRLDDLDSLPAPIFDFVRDGGDGKRLHFFDRRTRQLKQATAVVTSRSCPFRCSFCAIILIGRKWRKASAWKIVEDLAAMERHRSVTFGHIYFLDANFFVDPRRTLEVARELNAYRPTLTFSFSTRVNQLIRGKSYLAELERLGLRAIELGIESGSDAALRRFTKDTSSAQNAEAIRLLNANNIQLFLDFVMFDAEATLEDLRLNIDFLEANSLDTYVPWDHIFSYMTPYLGTAIRTHYEQISSRTFEEDALPDPVTLILDSKVRDIFREVNNLRPIVPQMAKALWATESRIGGDWCEEQARLKLNAATLRRLPYLLLRNLIRQAESGQPIALKHAFPTFFGDDGEAHTCEEFLTYALH